MAARAKLTAPGAPAVVPAVMFEAADDRPEGYPAALPFVAGYAVSVTEQRPGMQHGPSAQWWGVPDPEAVLARLLRTSQEEGWLRAAADEDGSPPALAAQLVRLRRGDRGRTIIASRVGRVGMVTLADRALG